MDQYLEGGLPVQHSSCETMQSSQPSHWIMLLCKLCIYSEDIEDQHTPIIIATP